VTVARGDRTDFTIPLEDGIELYEKASARALARIADLGVDIIVEDKPKNRDGSYFDGRLPANINDYTADELAELYGLTDRYANWISCYVSVARAELKNKEEQLKLVKARVRKTKLGTKDDKEDETICDARYQERNAEWVEAYEYHHLLENVEAAARRNMATISRLVETMKIGFEQGRRAGNINRRDRFSETPSHGGLLRRKKKKGDG
jgi:hypothetical protein